MAEFNLGRAFFETSLDLRGLNRDLNKAEQTVRRFSGKIERQVKGGKAFDFVRPFKGFGSTVAKESRTATQGFSTLTNATADLSKNMVGLISKWAGGAAVLLTLTNNIRASAQAAMEFGVAIANIDTLMVNSTEQMQLLRSGVLQLAGIVGEGATPLASALYDIVSAGYAGAEGLSVLEASAKAARAGLTTTKVAADAVTTTLNAYAMSADQAQRVTDILQTTVRFGKTTWGELAPAIGQVIPLAAAAGVKFEELSAALAVLTGNGVQTAQAVTQVRSLISALLKDTSQAREVMKKYGFSINATTLQQKGLAGTLEILNNAIGGNTEALFKLLGRVEAVNAALALTSEDGFRKLLDVIDEMENAGGAVERGFNRQMEEAKTKIDVFKAKLGALRIELGERLLPVIGNVYEGLGKLIDQVNRLINPDLRVVQARVKALGVEAGIEDVSRLESLVKKERDAREQMQETLNKIGRLKFGLNPSNFYERAKAMAEVAKKAGLGEEELRKFNQAIEQARHTANTAEAWHITGTAIKELVQTIRAHGIESIKQLREEFEKTAKGGKTFDDLSAEVERLSKSLNSARQQAIELGDAEIFRTKARSVIKELKTLANTYPEIAGAAQKAVANIQRELEGFKVTVKPEARTDTRASPEDIFGPLAQKAQNIALKIDLKLVDTQTAERQLQNLKRQAQNLLGGTTDVTQQNQGLLLIKSIDSALETLKRTTKSTDDTFDEWLKKMKIQAERGLVPIEDIQNALAGARANLQRQIAELGPIDSPQKLEILFTLDTKLEGVNNLLDQLKEKTEPDIKAYEEYYGSRLKGLGITLGKEAEGAIEALQLALEGKIDYGAVISSADTLQNILAADWIPIPEHIRKVAKKTLAAFNDFGKAIADGNETVAKALASQRYGGQEFSAYAMRRSFDSAADGLLYLANTGQLTEDSLRALVSAFGGAAQTIDDATLNFDNLNRAFGLGLITQDEYASRLRAARDTLSLLIQQVEQGSPAFEVLADTLLKVNGALESLPKIKTGFGLEGVDDLGEALKILAADAQVDREEAIALAKGFGTTGEALAGVVGGLNTWRSRLDAGLITQEKYANKLEVVKGILEDLTIRYQNDPVLLEFYANALANVNRELGSIKGNADALDQITPEELQRRIAGLVNTFKGAGEALKYLARDGKLTEQEIKLLETAFGSQAGVIVDAISGLRELRTAYDHNLISADEFKEQLNATLPALQAAFLAAKQGSPAWFMLAKAIDAVKTALEDLTQPKTVSLSDQIEQEIAKARALKESGLYGGGLDAEQKALNNIADALRSKISEAIVNGMSPDSPEIQTAVAKLEETEIHLSLVTAGINLKDTIVEGAVDIGTALANYLVKGGDEAANALYSAIQSAGAALASTLSKIGADLGGKIGAKVGEKVGEGIGGAAGGAIGSVFGPAGSVLGSVLGTVVGTWLGSLFDSLFGKKETEPVNVPDQRVKTSVSEINYTAIANLEVNERANIRDPQFRSELRGFVRQTATELLNQLGLIRRQTCRM